MMEITYNEKEKQCYINPLLEDHSEKKEMSFRKPVGFVPLAPPLDHPDQTVAYYLAAAGGEWVPESVSIVFVVL
jgi:hypothetical protein